MSKRKTAASTDATPEEQALGDALEQEATAGDDADTAGGGMGTETVTGDPIGDVFGELAYSRRSQRPAPLDFGEGQVSPPVIRLLQELEQRVVNLEAWAESAERGKA